MTILICANGDIVEGEWVRDLATQARLIIAADGGARHLQLNGIKPDIMIGDFDSITENELTELSVDGAKIVRHPEDKDETDLELALIYAAEHYEEEIVIIGALGGRLDQMLGNVFLLAHPIITNHTVEIRDQYQRIWLIHDETVIQGAKGDFVSLIPVDPIVKVLRTQGLVWPLKDEALKIGYGRGISNRLNSESATITLATGRLLCIHTRFIETFESMANGSST